MQGHIVTVSHCPVGIDAERVAKDTLRPGIQPKLESLRALYADKKIIVGRDKLDVVKGVLHKVCLSPPCFVLFSAKMQLADDDIAPCIRETLA